MAAATKYSCDRRYNLQYRVRLGGTHGVHCAGKCTQGYCTRGMYPSLTSFNTPDPEGLKAEYLPLPVLPPTTDGKPPAILAEFVKSIIPQSHASFTFVPVRFSEQQWSDILDSADQAPSKPLGGTDGIYSHGFEHAAALASDWGCGFAQERRSAFLLLRMLLDERLLI